MLPRGKENDLDSVDGAVPRVLSKPRGFLEVNAHGK